MYRIVSCRPLVNFFKDGHVAMKSGTFIFMLEVCYLNDKGYWHFQCLGNAKKKTAKNNLSRHPDKDYTPQQEAER